MNGAVASEVALYLAVAAAVIAVPAAAQSPIYTNVWGVEVVGGLGAANSVAIRHGLLNLGQVGTLVDLYEFVLPLREDQFNNSGPFPQITEALLQEQSVIIAEQQVVLDIELTRYREPTDPLWPMQQFYLSVAVIDNHLHVEAAWIQAFTGCGVTVAIVDNGVDFTHADLRRNYLLDLDLNAITGAPTAFPGITEGRRDTHGTNTAGVVGMEKSNDVCGVGVAYNAHITGILLINGEQTDKAMATALNHENDVIHIYCNAWGAPSGAGNMVDGPRTLTLKALAQGVREGRDGKGSIFVFGAGNGGQSEDSCAADGYVQSIYTIAIGALNSDGRPTSYDERCSAKMASAFVNDINTPNAVVTTKVGGCEEEFDGTSAATGIASGTIALVLEAKPELTWRDIQYLLVYTSNPDVAIVGDRSFNGVRLVFSHSYGFGAIDAEALVTRAQHWIPVPAQQMCTIDVFTVIAVPPTDVPAFPTEERITVLVTDDKVVSLEHVVVQITLSFRDDDDILEPDRGNMVLELVSPFGTKSILLPDRFLDFGAGEYENWPFMSVHYWGENPTGNWTLIVKNRGITGVIEAQNIQFTFYGTAEIPEAVRNIPETCDEACARGCARPGPQFCDTCRQLRIAENLMCVDACPAGLVERRGYCYDATLPEPTCPNAAEYECSHKCDKCSKGTIYKKWDACYDVCLLHQKLQQE